MWPMGLLLEDNVLEVKGIIYFQMNVNLHVFQKMTAREKEKLLIFLQKIVFLHVYFKIIFLETLENLCKEYAALEKSETEDNSSSPNADMTES